METYDIIIVNRIAGLFDAGLLVHSSSHGDNGYGIPNLHSKEYTITTSNEKLVGIIHTAAYDSWNFRGVPRDYKSRIIGPRFEIDGVWGRSLSELDNTWHMKISHDRAMNCPNRSEDLDDLRLVSRFIMSELKPDGKYLYGHAADDIKGRCIVVDRGTRVAVFWDSGPVELGDNIETGIGFGFDINIANPECGKIAREWLMEEIAAC
jgi:hypothetical protein